MIPINPKFKKTEKLLQQYEGYIAAHPELVEELAYMGLFEFLKHPNGKDWEEVLSQCYKKEYRALVEAGKYFTGSPFKLYKDTYANRLSKYLLKHEDAEEINFIVKQYKSTNEYKPFVFSSKTLDESIRLSLNRVKDFLLERANEKGYNITYEEDNDGVILYKYSKENLDNPDSNILAIDLSDSSSVKKVLYLNELGVIDFLKKKQTSGYSILQIASVISAITGEKVSTIQSNLNPINNLSVNQKNNPYNNFSNVHEVQTNLIRLNFK